MKALEGVAFAAGALAVVALLIWLLARNSRKRADQAAVVAAWAAENGMSFAQEDPRYAPYALGTERGGVNSKALNVMAGSRAGRPVFAFEQREYVSRVNSAARYSFHQVFAVTPHYPPPEFHLLGRGWTAAATPPVPIDGGRFDARYRVLATNPDAARAFFMPGLQQWLLSFDAPELRTIGPCLTTRVPGKLAPRDIDGYFSLLTTVLSLAHPSY